jgi:YD repeat-containing protein
MVFAAPQSCVKRSAGREVGPPPPQPRVCINNPCDVSTGRKLAFEADIVFPGGALLDQRRNFSTKSLATALNYGFGEPLGRDWMGRWWQSLNLSNFYGSPSVTLAHRADGKLLYFLAQGANWVPDADVNIELIEVKSGSVRTGWKLVDEGAVVIESYDPAGVLLSITDARGRSAVLTYSTASTPPAIAPRAGLVIAVTDSFGRVLNFTYDAQGRVNKAIDPAGNEYVFGYDESSSVVLSGQPLGNNLTSVTYPDGRRRVYHYNEQNLTGSTNLPNALTGISEELEAATLVRYATYQYEAAGKAIVTEHAGGAARYEFAYTLDGNGRISSTAVTDPLGTVRTFAFAPVLDVNHASGITQPAPGGSSTNTDAYTYDTQGNIASRVNFNNARTCYAYQLSRNVETARIEGMVSADTCPADVAGYTPAGGTAQRKVLTQWHPDWRLQARRAEPKRITTWVYNGQPDPTAGGATVTCAPGTALVDGKPIAVLCRQVEQATSDETGAAGFGATAVGTARIQNWTYNEYGQVLTHDGARTDVGDVTSYEYYPDTQADWTRGDLKQVSNALGQVTRFTKYDRNGRVLETLDPNNVRTTSTYSPRGWLTQQVVTPSGGGASQTTVYEYDGAGQLKRVTAPDGSFVSYTYDDARRLTQVDDSAGNRVQYVLDAMGNRTAENWKDSGGALRKTLTRVIDALNRVQTVTGGMQ